MTKPTLVLGASTKPDRYSNIAIRSLRRKGHEVTALGLRKGMVDDVEIITEIPTDAEFHTVAVYLGAANQKPIYDTVLNLGVKRVIFPPGAENREFEEKLKDSGVEVVRACTMVMLSTGEF